MDIEFKKLLAGGKWAETGDRADPDDAGISPTLDRAVGWPAPYSQGGVGGATPDRRRMNQQFRELTGAAFEVRNGISQYDAEVDYPVSAFTAKQSRLFRAKVANGPGSSNVTDPDNDSSEAVWERVSGSVTLPDAPREALFDNSVRNQISLRWKNGRDGGRRVLSYNLQYRSLETATWSPDMAISAPYAQHTITGLTSGQVIVVRIQSVTAEGVSPWYTTAADAPNNRVTGNEPSGGDSLGLRGEPGDAKIRARWIAPLSDGGFPIQRYRLQWRTGASTFSASNETTIAPELLTYDITGLVNDSLYYLRVRAENRAGSGAWSNIAQATPMADTQLTVQPTPRPPSASRSGSTITASARWTNAEVAPTATPTSARWQYRTGTSGSWSNSSHQGITGFTLLNTSASVAYQIRALLVTDLGSTDYSDPATVAAATNKATAPSPPRNVRINSGGLTGQPPSWNGSVTWSTPSSNGGGVITGYQLRVTYSWVSGERSGSVGGNTHIWRIGAGVAPTSGSVRVYVRASNHLGYYSSWASASFSY